MIGSWFGKSLETVLKNNLSFAGEILMNIEQNSVKYDATKKQITVTTYYDKNLYFDTYNSLTPNWYYKVLR